MSEQPIERIRIAELSEQFDEFIEAAVYIANDVERTVLGLLVIP